MSECSKNLTENSKNLTTKEKLKSIFSFLEMMFSRVSTFIGSLIAIIVLPSIPLIVEFLKTGDVKSENFLLTACVFAASFIFLAEKSFFGVLYCIIFIATLVADIGYDNQRMSVQIAPWGLRMYLGVTLLHVSERFWKHVVWGETFLDGWLERV